MCTTVTLSVCVQLCLMSVAKFAKQTNFTVNEKAKKKRSPYAFRGVNCVALRGAKPLPQLLDARTKACIVLQLNYSCNFVVNLVMPNLVPPNDARAKKNTQSSISEGAP